MKKIFMDKIDQMEKIIRDKNKKIEDQSNQINCLEEEKRRNVAKMFRYVMLKDCNMTFTDEEFQTMISALPTSVMEVSVNEVLQGGTLRVDTSKKEKQSKVEEIKEEKVEIPVQKEEIIKTQASIIDIAPYIAEPIAVKEEKPIFVKEELTADNEEKSLFEEVVLELLEDEIEEEYEVEAPEEIEEDNNFEVITNLISDKSGITNLEILNIKDNKPIVVKESQVLGYINIEQKTEIVETLDREFDKLVVMYGKTSDEDYKNKLRILYDLKLTLGDAHLYRQQQIGNNFYGYIIPVQKIRK